MADVERTLIVGGGIGGLTLAAALHQRGFAAELVERRPTLDAEGAGIAVQPNGVRILRALGMDARVAQVGAIIRRWDFCSLDGDVLSETNLEKLWGSTDPFLGVARSRLHEALTSAAAAVPLRLAVGVTDLSQDNRRVHVTFSDGSAGEYDLVVGADGINSTVRRLAVDDEPPAYGGQMVWRAIAPIRPRGLTKLQFLLGDGCFFGLCPVGDGGTYGFANTSEPRFHDEPEGRLERVRARFASFGSIVHEYLGALDSDDSLHCSAIEWLEREAWSNGRVVLIGDAAHAGSPMMGQGGCLAMEDAYVLAEELSNAPSVESALASYIARRAPRVKWVREHSRAVGESLRLPSAVRNGVLRQRGDQLLQDRYRPLVAEA